MAPGEVSGLKNAEAVMAGVLGRNNIIKLRWLTGCYGLIGKRSDFELYSVVDRKPVEITKSLSC